MLRLRINELIAECNQNREDEGRITMQDVADALGVARGTLSALTRFNANRPPVTNTAYLEGLVRYFHRSLRRTLTWQDLMEFDPPLEQTVTVVVDELYPERAARTPHRHEARQRRLREG